MKFLCVIPARYASTRLPGKPLALIAGKPMIQHVVERAQEAKSPDKVLVATDHPEVAEKVKTFGGEVILTSPDHPTGTDRLAEVAAAFTTAEVIINVQGDEPMIDPLVIDQLAEAFRQEPHLDMATLACPLEEEEEQETSVVKVVFDQKGYALYFSRSLIPYPRNRQEACPAWKHIGIYAYRRDFLLTYAGLAPTPLEKSESLEQLRALEHGYKIKVLTTNFKSLGVDTPEDLARVNQLMTQK